jgi:hypothetical protein
MLLAKSLPFFFEAIGYWDALRWLLALVHFQKLQFLLKPKANSNRITIFSLQ